MLLSELPWRQKADRSYASARVELPGNRLMRIFRLGETYAISLVRSETTAKWWGFDTESALRGESLYTLGPLEAQAVIYELTGRYRPTASKPRT